MPTFESELIQLILRLVSFTLLIQNIEFIYLFLFKKEKLITKPIFYSSIFIVILSVICILKPNLIFTPFYMLHLFMQFVVFRGLYNGGSTSMTQQTVLALCVAFLFQNKLANQFVLYYIALQSLASYWIAGLVKIKEPTWRHGTALTQIMTCSHYQIPSRIKSLFAKNSIAFFVSWLIMIFEISLPLIFLQGRYLIFIFLILFIFHLFNAFIFGINRFIFAWLATYPAIYYLFAHR